MLSNEENMARYPNGRRPIHAFVFKDGLDTAL